jgi:ribokinase
MSTEERPIVVVGSINLDFVTNAEHIPAVGETVCGNEFQMHPGGKGANQAVAIARLGYPVKMIASLGSDAPGDQLRGYLQDAGVGIEGVEKVDGSSGVAMIVVSDRGDNCIVVTPGANAAVTPEVVDRHIDLIRQAGLVLTQLEIPLPTILHLAELCVRAGVPLMLDPAPARSLPASLFKLVRWFTPNETEAAFYIGDTHPGVSASEPSETARLLLTQGPAGVLLKMGELGAYLADQGFEQKFAPVPVKVVDTTAAGDAFNGAFAVGMMLGKTAQESARFAVAASALAVTRAGAQSSMPTRPEVDELLASQVQI